MIELIVVIVVGGVIAGVFALFLTRPMQGYQDLNRRAALVEAGEGALRRMARDIRIALPNSVRVTNNPGGVPGFALELIPTVDGARYCALGLANCAGANQELDFTAADTDFDVLGCFRNPAFIAAAAGGSAGYRLVINNLGNEVYTGAGSPAVITAAGTSLTLSVNPGPGGCPGGGSHHLRLAPGHQFFAPSPRQRVFVVPDAAAMTWFCDAAQGTLRRYAGYAITDPQPVNPAAAPLNTVTGALAADRVSACSVTTSADQVRQTGIVILDLALSSQGETVRLLHQVQLDNSP